MKTNRIQRTKQTMMKIMKDRFMWWEAVKVIVYLKHSKYLRHSKLQKCANRLDMEGKKDLTSVFKPVGSTRKEHNLLINELFIFIVGKVRVHWQKQ